jgi:NADPH2:quinone reductase
VNPLTALGMVETMKREGHKALVHTAAASNLGQMLQKICLADGVELVNIVRKPEQVEILKSIGAAHVCNSSDPDFMEQLVTDFMEQLVTALAETGATIAFDATGGGKLASQILTAMEAAQNRTATEFSRYGSTTHKQVYIYGAANRTATEFSRYGSTTHKQVYIYGGLDRGPTELTRGFGMAWGVGGWLLTPFLQQIGFDEAQKLRERVAAEVKTTFASSYVKEVSLAEALQLDEIGVYKYLINPNKGL